MNLEERRRMGMTLPRKGTVPKMCFAWKRKQKFWYYPVVNPFVTMLELTLKLGEASVIAVNVF